MTPTRSGIGPRFITASSRHGQIRTLNLLLYRLPKSLLTQTVDPRSLSNLDGAMLRAHEQCHKANDVGFVANRHFTCPPLTSWSLASYFLQTTQS